MENSKSDLDSALGRLKKTIESSNKNIRNFETSTGFLAYVEFFDNNRVNLTLQKGGQTSVFDITPEGAAEFMGLRGIDGEIMDEEHLIISHKEEAGRLISNNELHNDADDDRQFKLDI